MFALLRTGGLGSNVPCADATRCVLLPPIAHVPVCRLSAVRTGLSSKRVRRSCCFTLLELLIVMGIVGLLFALIAPAFTTIKGGGDVTNAAYTIKGALDTARTYAKANNTYAWVGFFEEDFSNPATAGTGRIVMSIVASKDGT